MEKRISFVGVQTHLTANKEENLKQALCLVDEALSLYKDVDMLVLPEYFYWAPDPKDTPFIEEYPEYIIEEFSSRAKFYNTYILAGTVANKRADGNIYNTAMLFGRDGKIVGKYDKVHLFDALNAQFGERESDQISRGKNLLIYDTDFGKIGVNICYDLRFPEMARTLALKGVEYLLIPSAFYSPRADHWQNLICATALQNSMYVIGVNLFGELNQENIFCGRSLVADPWGIPVAIAADKPGSFQAYVYPEHLKEIRDSIGTFYNRIPDMYDIK